MARNKDPDPAEDEFLDESTVIGPANVLTVHNVLASGSFISASGTTKLDLDKCCTILGNSYYNPSEFPTLRIDIRSKSNSSVFTMSLFESGKIQSTGGCRPIESKKAMMKIAKRINQKLNYGVMLQNFQIQNVLAVYDFCCPVNLGQFASSFQGIVDYEPDRFPAVRVRIPIPNSRKRGGGALAVDGQEGDDHEGQRVTQKLRKMMMGDVGGTITASGAVGSYIIGSTARRPVSNKVKEEKLGKEESVTANVFSTGKITFTGAKSISSLNYALSKLRPAITGVQGSSNRVTSIMISLIRYVIRHLQNCRRPALLNPELQSQIMRLQQQQYLENHLESTRSQQTMMFTENLPSLYPPMMSQQYHEVLTVPSPSAASVMMNQSPPPVSNVFSRRRLALNHQQQT